MMLRKWFSRWVSPSAVSQTRARYRQPMLEALEDRVVMTAKISLVKGVLRAVCNNAATSVTLSHDGNFTTLNNVRVADARISRIEIIGGRGHDTIDIQGTPARPVVVNGRGGNDTVTIDFPSAARRVVLNGGAGNNSLAGPDADTLWQIMGRNRGVFNQGAVSFANFTNLTGGDATDTFKLANGQGVSGVIDGGGGVNTLDYETYRSDVFVNLDIATATKVDGGIRNIHNLFGGAANDILLGDAGNNLLDGRAGVDHLDGQGGIDQLNNGENRLHFNPGLVPEVTATYDPSTGILRVEGTDNADNIRVIRDANNAVRVDGVTIRIISGGTATEVNSLSNIVVRRVEVHAGGGDDQVVYDDSNSASFNPTNVTFHGGEGNDTLIGGSAADILLGEQGNDNLSGRGGADVLNGGDGNDGLFGGIGRMDELVGGRGADRFLQVGVRTTVTEEDIRDLTPEDAVIRFVNYRARVNKQLFSNKFWRDTEVEAIDRGLSWLHGITNNTRLLRLQSGDELNFYRIQNLGTAAADNDSRGHIRFADASFGIGSANRPDQDVVHEIAHNWDDENPNWVEFQGFSGWQALPVKQKPPAGFTRAVNLQGAAQPWIYRTGTPFALAYGRKNPRDDFATCLEMYYTKAAIDGPQGNWQVKWNFIDNFLKSMRTADNLGGWVSQVTVGTNQDGRMEMFGIAGDGTIWHRRQVAPFSHFSPWVQLSNNLHAQQIAVGMNQDGRMELFAIGTDNAVYHAWQVAPNSYFSDWDNLGGTVRQIKIGTNADGRMELFAIALDNAVWHRWQVAPNSYFAPWTSLYGSVQQIEIGTNADGRLEIFAIGWDNAVWHSWQVAPNSYFAPWTSLGGSTVQQIAVGKNQDGRIELFAIGGDNAIYHMWQVAPNSQFTGWHFLRGHVQQLVVGSTADGRMDLYAIGGDGNVYHMWQKASNSHFSEWNKLTMRARQLALGYNAAGGAELYGIEDNNSAWHLW